VANALVRLPSPTMGAGLTTQALGEPDFEKAAGQHRAYVEALEEAGVTVRRLPPEPSLPDSHFVEDTAVIHRGVAILTRPGAGTRRAEVDRIRPVLERELEVVDLGPASDATLDGGDVLIAGRHVLIGVSKRTNPAGADGLAQRLREVDPGLRIDSVPFEGVLHLKSGVTALRPDAYVGDPAIRLARKPPAPVHWLPPAEGYAANVLPVNDTLFVLAGSPAVRSLADRYCARVVPLDLSEFRKMDGSLTCLSLLW
jgi:dimethylargininase